MPFFAYHAYASILALQFDCRVLYMMVFEYFFDGLSSLLGLFFEGLIIQYYVRCEDVCFSF